MLDKIVTDKDILHQVSEDTTWDRVKELDLKHRLKNAGRNGWTPGCGLAAIQIGIALRYAWFIFNGKEFELINPEIIFKHGTVRRPEGCLSVPNQWPIVKRAHAIEYISDGKKKRAKGVKAQIIQHEIDHMNGILNVDHVKVEEVKDEEKKRD